MQLTNSSRIRQFTDRIADLFHKKGEE
jgi:hypothetical protein